MYTTKFKLHSRNKEGVFKNYTIKIGIRRKYINIVYTRIDKLINRKYVLKISIGEVERELEEASGDIDPQIILELNNDIRLIVLLLKIKF